MKHSLGRMSLGMKFACILAVALLLPGVTSKSIRSSVETAVTGAPNVLNEPGTDVPLEKDPVLSDSEIEAEEPEPEIPEGGVTDLDDSLGVDENEENLEDTKEVTELPQDADEEEPEEEDELTVEDSPKDNNETEVNTVEDDESIDRDKTDLNIANLTNNIAKRDVDEADDRGESEEEDGPEPESVDEDSFSISDVSEILEPLIQYFSKLSKKEAPPPNVFLSWFPELKEILELVSVEPTAAKEKRSATEPTREATSSYATEPESFSSSAELNLGTTFPTTTSELTQADLPSPQPS